MQIDKILNKFVSRKLLVFVITCVGLFLGDIDSSDWVIIATAYISIQGFTDIVNGLKQNRDE
jgi:hypothetical protein